MHKNNRDTSVILGDKLFKLMNLHLPYMYTNNLCLQRPINIEGPSWTWSFGSWI